ncbi:putative atp-dependent rna helicase dbp6 [Phaeomoniella chlamydospora]|uniref:ATP-dependent RNA helicase n=1 Tax=Phaeomoniella chlamydospora TaxID=158046 RepID=A0A0G2GZY0_PHACM|nr:putative atp-dependent rna helicase dbp6 [Phaeomoniella chlamydospora]
MSGAFYARYVPPAAPISQLNDVTVPSGRKRKLNSSAQVNTNDVKEKAHKKSKASSDQGQSIEHDATDEIGVLSTPQARRGRTENNNNLDKPPPIKTADNENVLDKYSITKFASSRTPNTEVQYKKGEPHNSQRSKWRQKLHFELSDGGEESRAVSVADNDEHIGDGNATSKHTSVLSKFKRSREAASKIERQVDDDEESIQELHGLDPLPQPAPASVGVTKPTYPTLPQWLASPTRVPAFTRSRLTDVKIDGKILHNLEGQGISEAFAVQSAVLPLLIGDVRYNGDLCISAATGSGKTLAYVLPMIQGLMGYATTRLRGLIVVPTRELVKQARDICELCSSGTGLKIASAVGSRSLKDEQDLIIEHYEQYRPTKTKDSSASMTVDDWINLDLRKLMDQPQHLHDKSLSSGVRSKVDILICTPGRLVEHLRSTEGFHLSHLEWLVIDEADRLMSESFQDWVETVIPALEDDRPEDQSLTNEILRQAHVPRPARKLQKVVLSATFTKDISKLNSLQLRNPRLIVVGDHEALTDEGVQHDEQRLLHLPQALLEYAVPVGDGSEKPLYLLELLRQRVHMEVADTEPSSPIEDPDDETSDSEASSDSETSSSESSSDSSDESDETASTNSDKEDKPAQHKRKSRCLVFTGSTESAERLLRLLTILDPRLAGSVGTLTKTSARSSRRAISDLRRGKLSILIATDRASRGLDIPELEHVISYDVPNSVTTYVHRVGRTARAGRSGQAWTLIAHREARWFWNEIGKGNGEIKLGRGGRVQKKALRLSEDEDARAQYEQALKTLGEEVKEQK